MKRLVEWEDSERDSSAAQGCSTHGAGQSSNPDHRFDETGGKDVPVKLILRIIRADNHVFEMHDPRKGEKSKTMEISYTRK